MLMYFLTCVFLFAFSPSQAQICNCTDPTANATWIGDAIPDSNQSCVGQCSRQINRIRLCFTRSTSSSEYCRIGKINCTDPPSCDGNWTPWDNEGECSNPCGAGRQMQVRICFDENGFRTSRCLGSNGLRQQVRFFSCMSMRNCTSTTTTSTSVSTSTTAVSTPLSSPTTSPTESSTFASTRVATTTVATQPRPSTAATTRSLPTPSKTFTTRVSTRPFTAPTTRSSPTPSTASVTFQNLQPTNSTTMLSQSPLINTTIGSGLASEPSTTILTTKLRTGTTPSNSQVISKLTLPLVLCSVAVICVAVIISFVIVFKRKPQDRMQHSVLVSSNTKDNNDDDEKKESHDYEVVGPALPSRKPKTSPEKKNGDISLTVHNVLYSKEGKDSEVSLKYTEPSKMEDDDDDSGYLTPLNTSAPKQQPKTPTSQQRTQEKQLLTFNAQNPQSNAKNDTSAHQAVLGNNKLISPIPQRVVLIEDAAGLEQGIQLNEISPSTRANQLKVPSNVCSISNVDEYQKLSDITAQNNNSKPKVFHADPNYVANVNDVPVFCSKQKDVSNQPPVEGDYVRDISMLMKPLSPPKTDHNKDLSNLGYVTVEQLKSRNLI